MASSRLTAMSNSIRTVVRRPGFRSIAQPSFRKKEGFFIGSPSKVARHSHDADLVFALCGRFSAIPTNKAAFRLLLAGVIVALGAKQPTAHARGWHSRSKVVSAQMESLTGGPSHA